MFANVVGIKIRSKIRSKQWRLKNEVVLLQYFEWCLMHYIYKISLLNSKKCSEILLYCIEQIERVNLNQRREDISSSYELWIFLTSVKMDILDALYTKIIIYLQGCEFMFPLLKSFKLSNQLLHPQLVLQGREVASFNFYIPDTILYH
ncbi:Hypothetical_protein [Hexamita inflata]|uniref:Hypothetical_protein n=1 Tax=Hexamita inflata TaxID=28002 RepID=A0ABP1HHG9_9EUKA